MTHVYYYYYYYNYYYYHHHHHQLQLICHSVAVVLTLVLTKQIRIYINETIQKTQHKQYNTKQ